MFTNRLLQDLIPTSVTLTNIVHSFHSLVYPCPMDFKYSRGNLTPLPVSRVNPDWIKEIKDLGHLVIVIDLQWS